ncbi:MAG: ornithine carbamoyltransferase [Vampirovibrionales bacterium]|nr:ornithine carbamoyltransferase [Vampirovibrionales bacterium]
MDTLMTLSAPGTLQSSMDGFDFQKLVSLKGRDFLTILDLTPQECQTLLGFARQLKMLKRGRVPHRFLNGRSVAMYFEKPSNRTRVSFEVGIYDLGAHPLYLRKEEINLGVRETIADTARTLSRYVDAIMIRTFAHKDVEELAEWASVPIINGLTDDHHPCQVLADLQTIQEHLGGFKGQKLVFAGDGCNNMSHSLMEGAALVGMDFAVACPPGHEPSPVVLARAQKMAEYTGSRITVTNQMSEALKGATVVYADVWASMGQEAEAEARKAVMMPYQVNGEAMAQADPKAIVLHCLPAHRGEEITHEVLERYADVIFDEAENRLHAQKALMAAVMA